MPSVGSMGLRRAKRRAVVGWIAVAALIGGIGSVVSTSRPAVAQTPQAPRPIERELIFGSELMTDEELDRYRDEMARLPTNDAQVQYRERHRQRLRDRARARGQELQEPAGILRRRDAR